MSDKEATERVRISQVLAGALAAVTAALIGSTMGVAGTVIGAGLASIVSTVGGVLYQRSIDRTTESVRTVRAKVVGRSGGTTVLVSEEDPEKEPDEEVRAEPVSDDEPDDRPPAERGRRRWPMVVVGSLAAFVLGMLAVTGVEWLRGEPLSGGTGTTFGSIVEPHRDSGGRPEQPPDPTTSTTTPTSSESERPPATTTAPTSGTATTTPPSDSSSTTTTTTTTTTTPPETTTTEVEPPGGSVIPTN